MTFTEIVFEVGDDRYPLCRLTSAPSDAVGVLRVLDAGRGTGRFRSLITFYGNEAGAQALLRELRARPGGENELVSSGDGVVTVRCEAPLADPGAAARVLAVLKLVESFGPDTIVEPFLVRRGRLRARVLVPKRLDAQRALATLQDAQRAAGFGDFRVVRVATIDATRYLDLLRRVLTPEQEDLLRLAASMGYYDTPKGATLDDIAQRVGLSVSPVHKRLKGVEEILVSAHVDPSSLAHLAPRRRRRREIELPAAWPAEVALRVKLSSSRLAAFTGANPGARVLLQVLALDQAAGHSTLLLVALAPEPEHDALLEEFQRRPDVLSTEIVDRDRTHVSAKVVLRLSPHAGATFPWWYDVWGTDAVMRPLVFEDGHMMLRFLVVRPLPEAELRARLEKCAKLAGWDDYEFVSARSADDARAAPTAPEPPTPRQEEVLKIAHALGYYRTPRACTLEQVAATLGVSANAIHKNLSSAESKVIAGYLSAGL